MIIEDRARVLWAKSLDDALGGGQYNVILTIIIEEQDRIQPIPEHFLVDALRSFFTYPPPFQDARNALAKMGLIAGDEEEDQDALQVP